MLGKISASRGARKANRQKLLDHALLLASSCGDLASVKELLANGADPNCRDRYGRTPLMVAAFFGFDEIVEALVKAGSRIEERAERGGAGSHFGCCGTNRTHPDGFTAIRYAVLGGRRRIVEHLLDIVRTTA
ncbi:MAG: ankyrin repeat domain-containing protein [Candidatus Hydrogenedentota bacterium]|nr:MAG: ankyrin repeat domain-containing protein [Candidatus Hydrogenedentota bacterium]